MKTSISGNIEYVGDVWFAFNPCFVTIKNYGIGYYATVKIGGHAIVAALYNREGQRVYLSRLLQEAFPKQTALTERCMLPKIEISIANKNEAISEALVFDPSIQSQNYDETLKLQVEPAPLVIWGTLNLGERIANIGVYPKSDKLSYVRHARWFTKFPFGIDTFIENPSEIHYRIDGLTYKETANRYLGELDALEQEITGSRDFDEKFNNVSGDFPELTEQQVIERLIEQEFNPLPSVGLMSRMARSIELDESVKNTGRGIIRFVPSEMQILSGNQYVSGAKHNAVIRIDEGITSFYPKNDENATQLLYLTIDNNSCGYYFRWVDSHGLLCYFLFTEGISDIKTTAGDKIQTDITYNNMDFGLGYRYNRKTGQKTIKCSALTLSEEEYEMVKTIATSVIVDMYVGKTESGEQLWQPVTIAGKNYSYNEHNRKWNFDIEVDLPEQCTQTL